MARSTRANGRSSWRLAREGETAHSGKALINAVTRSSAPALAPTCDETCRDGCGSGPRWVKRQVFPGSEPRGTAAVDDPALASPHCWPTWSYPHWTVVHRSTTCSPSWCGSRGRTRAGGTCGSRAKRQGSSMLPSASNGSRRSSWPPRANSTLRAAREQHGPALRHRRVRPPDRHVTAGRQGQSHRRPSSGPPWRGGARRPRPALSSAEPAGRWGFWTSGAQRQQP